MPRYSVQVSFTSVRDIKVWARDAQQAEEKALDIVEGCENASDPEAHEVEEVDD